MNKKIFLFICTLTISACCDRSTKDAALIFEKDGCSVYKFYDEGRAVYFANCAGSVEWREDHHPGSDVDVVVNTYIKGFRRI